MIPSCRWWVWRLIVPGCKTLVTNCVQGELYFVHGNCWWYKENVVKLKQGQSSYDLQPFGCLTWLSCVVQGRNQNQCKTGGGQNSQKGQDWMFLLYLTQYSYLHSSKQSIFLICGVWDSLVGTGHQRFPFVLGRKATKEQLSNNGWKQFQEKKCRENTESMKRK